MQELAQRLEFFRQASQAADRFLAKWAADCLLSCPRALDQLARDIEHLGGQGGCASGGYLDD